MKFNSIKILLFLACFSSFLLFPINNLCAQTDDPYGTQDMDLQLDQDLQPREAIVGIINLVLSFLGLLAVIIIIYGGFVWMTSGGDADKVNKAKKILRNGLIGLIIILVSWGLVTWLLGVLTDRDSGLRFTDRRRSIDPGWGAIGSCTIDSVYPEPKQKEVPRNTAIIISFKEKLKSSSVCVDERGGSNSYDCSENSGWINPENIKINSSHQDDNLVNAKALVSEDKKTITVNPQEFLGSSNGYTDYTVTISGFEKENGDLMLATCSSDWFSWTFEVSDKIDLSPPKVISKGVFPPPDNERDEKFASDSQRANGEIIVNNCLTAYQAGEIISYSPVGSSANIESVNINNNYSERYTKLTLTAGTGGQVQLKGEYNGNTDSLGVSTWQNNKVVFSSFYNLSLELSEDYQIGNEWTVEVQARILADTLTIGSTVYSFTQTGQEQNSIIVPSNCADQAYNINEVIKSHPSINTTLSGNTIEIEAVVGGSSGNSINIETTNTEALSISGMSGGINSESGYGSKDRADQPRNTTIQINFNKPMNPMTLSGNSADLENSIRVVNINNGEIINGTFYISNNFRTVEFVSDFLCGENGCGEEIYCLPSESNIEVQLIAASLKSCSSVNDCQAFQPFTQCGPGGGNSVCQDNEGNFLPTTDNFDSGIMDSFFNSLDGNRDGFSSGPQTFYNENNPNANDGDNFKWSFFISDEIILDPPKITYISPSQGSSFNGEDDIEIQFDSLMRSHTLRTGSVKTTGPMGKVEHKRINVFSAAKTVGYWVTSENIDSNNSGDPNYTKAYINHSGLSSSISWRAQVGSGVENIYQNCFKPSAGVGCVATDSNPSCCFGQPTSDLSSNGNCP